MLDLIPIAVFFGVIGIIASMQISEKGGLFAIFWITAIAFVAAKIAQFVAYTVPLG